MVSIYFFYWLEMEIDQDAHNVWVNKPNILRNIETVHPSTNSGRTVKPCCLSRLKLVAEIFHRTLRTLDVLNCLQTGNSAVSFIITTIGFAWAGISLFDYAL
jgi:hypothetical protein